jgi:hypothetical protein
MKEKQIILTIVKSIERKFSGLIVWAYQNSNESGTNNWWEIAISDYNIYTDNKFKKIINAWYKIAKQKNIKIIFCCGWKPKEKDLLKLANENNLIIS